MHEVHDKTDYRIFLFNDALLFTIPEDGKFRFKQMCHIENVSVRMGASIGNVRNTTLDNDIFPTLRMLTQIFTEPISLRIQHTL
jgi:hypothetical protein